MELGDKACTSSFSCPSEYIRWMRLREIVISFEAFPSFKLSAQLSLQSTCVPPTTPAPNPAPALLAATAPPPASLSTTITGAALTPVLAAAAANVSLAPANAERQL
ncbi:hypothetical protein NP233_g7958 [Leucocoprinus birnbaumii]|uniref:Uncharacterized protein n=1 Tax=Leucocoprinus birnbaumii TaxID=56174 RepID=A0AAD5YU57_9AGAR|nr:hypothetical protein NP233_g7958 [Leucocoprinus birnbaumii]